MKTEVKEEETLAKAQDTPVKHEPSSSDNDMAEVSLASQERALTRTPKRLCNVCTLLSFWGDVTCRECDQREKLRRVLDKTKTSTCNFASDSVFGGRQNDVVVLEDNEFWASHSDLRKLLAPN